jgi:fermentation-respiration switch protein FrsA (DUF1100 family)
MESIAQEAARPHGYRTETVMFQSEGVSIVGMLFLPLGDARKTPGVVILGPFGFIKEMAPTQYATRLARLGFAALIFDPRFSGESGGAPRRLESPTAKIADAVAALGYLASRPEVDAARIAALGICQGASEMIAVAATDARVKVLACVSGQYLYRANLEGFFGGGGPTLDQRIARGKAAKASFEADGAVDYTAVVDPTDKSVGLPWPPINDWYHPWTTSKWGAPSRWENRYATMSDAEVWSFDVDAYAGRLSLPTLLIHGEQSDGFIAAVTHVFDQIPAKKKQIEIVEGVFHTRFYDDPLVVEPAAAQVAAWFETHLT